jgi:hypothetical protein
MATEVDIFTGLNPEYTHQFYKLECDQNEKRGDQQRLLTPDLGA